MKNNRLVILLLVALSLASCTKELDIYPSANRQMVLNAEPQADSRAFVNFAYTRFLLDTSNNQPVAGADVRLVVNGVEYQSDSMSRCNYFFPYTLQGGDSLAVNINAAGRTVHASTVVPLAPVVSDFQKLYVRTDIFNSAAVSFKLSDHAGINEIYSIAVSERDSGMRYNEWTSSYDTIDTIVSTYFCLPNNPDITSNEVCPNVPLMTEPLMLYGSRIMFLDRKIAGRQNYQVNMLIPILVDSNEVAPFKHEFIIKVNSLTPDRYRYNLALARSGGMTSFFAEQGQMYGNVDGALGIFAGSSGVKYQFCVDSLITPTTPTVRRK